MTEREALVRVTLRVPDRGGDAMKGPSIAKFAVKGPFIAFCIRRRWRTRGHCVDFGTSEVPKSTRSRCSPGFRGSRGGEGLLHGLGSQGPAKSRFCRSDGSSSLCEADDVGVGMLSVPIPLVAGVTPVAELDRQSFRDMPPPAPTRPLRAPETSSPDYRQQPCDIAGTLTVLPSVFPKRRACWNRPTSRWGGSRSSAALAPLPQTGRRLARRLPERVPVGGHR